VAAKRLIRLGVVVLSAFYLTTAASAHTIPVEPTVTVNVRPDGEQLLVRVVVPMAGLADAELPRTEGRRLDRPAADDILRLVAREVANALSFAEGQQGLEPPAATVVIAADESQVEFALRYVLRQGRGPLSARLHTFPAIPQPLAMVATFEPADERPRTFVVSAAPERVVFEPGVTVVARSFAAHGGRMLLGNVDGLLMLLCLAVGVATRKALRWSVLAMAVAHTAGFVVRAGDLTPLSGTPSMLAGAWAASAVVAAAAALVVSARPAPFGVLAVLFGVLNGAFLGEQLRVQSSFAGAYPHVAVGSAALVSAVGQVWVVAVLATIIGILRARGLSDGLVRYAAAAWAGHTALHLIADRTIVPEGTESWWLTRLEMLILLAWVGALLVIAAIRASRGHAIAPAGPQATSSR
jgi:hypothetical protein